MFLRRFLLSLCFVYLASAGRGAAAQSVPPGSALPQSAVSAESNFALGAVDGLLLLKNGETLTGSISRSGDYYLVVNRQSELQIRARDAEAVCRDLEEVFARKLAILNVRSADAHLELAQWCIDRELYGHAARELTAAYRIDDLHPRIALLERRMKAAMTVPRTVPQPPKPVAPTIGDEELDKVVGGVSAESLHEFTVRVQPLLMNYCATAGCHGPRGNSTFHLERAYLNERTDPRVVKLNLVETLKQIDRRTPSNSKLLAVTITPHGGGKRPVFHAHNAEHFRMLAGWVGRMADSTRPSSAVPASASPAGTGTLSQRLPIAPPSASNKSPVAPVETKVSTPADAPAAQSSRSGGDPFDPSEFNGGRATPPAP